MIPTSPSEKDHADDVGEMVLSTTTHAVPWTTELTDLNQRLALTIAVAALNRATLAARAHAQASAAVARFEAGTLTPAQFATELEAVERQVAQRS